MRRRAIALLLCGALAAPACATSGARGVTLAPAADRQTVADAMADYVQRLPPGSRVRVDLADGSSATGTLMKATAQSIVFQKRTRVPEPPIEIPLREIVSVTPEPAGGRNTAKIVAIAAAASVGAVLGFFAILAAIYAD